MNNPIELERRLEALKLACGSARDDYDAHSVVSRAEAYFAFLSGEPADDFNQEPFGVGHEAAVEGIKARVAQPA